VVLQYKDTQRDAAVKDTQCDAAVEVTQCGAAVQGYAMWCCSTRIHNVMLQYKITQCGAAV
jgi:hypothetical protein